MDKIEIFTDGSSLGNPGPGGYGVIMKYKGLVKKASKGYKLTTNNRMELRAVLAALDLLKIEVARNKEIHIYTDSRYVCDAVEKGWVFGWQKKNYQNKANADLWRSFMQIYPIYKPKFHWIKGHNKHPENEACDKLAKLAAQGENLKMDTGYASANGVNKR